FAEVGSAPDQVCLTRSPYAWSDCVGKAKSCFRPSKGLPFPACPPFAKAVEVEVNDRRSVESQRLAKDEAADYRYAERPPERGAHPGRYDQWQRTEQGRRCRH